MPSPWSALEAVRGLVNFRAGWRRLAGDQFDALRLLCLQTSSLKPESYPCPAQCGCWHRIIPRHDGTGAVGACQCDSQACPDFPLTIEDITPLDPRVTPGLAESEPSRGHSFPLVTSATGFVAPYIVRAKLENEKVN
jgi:hypothetical protein